MRKGYYRISFKRLSKFNTGYTIIWELCPIVRHSIFNIDNILELAQESITIEAINQVIDETDAINCNQLIQADTSVSNIFGIVRDYTEVFDMDNIEYYSEPEPNGPSVVI